MATADAQQPGMSAADIAKLTLAAALAIAGIAGFYLLGDLALVLRVLAVLAGFAAGTVVALLSAPGRQFAGFASDSVGEVKKVVWPTRKETMQTTAAVFAFVVVMAVFLWLTDMTLSWFLYEVVLGWQK